MRWMASLFFAVGSEDFIDHHGVCFEVLFLELGFGVDMVRAIGWLFRLFLLAGIAFALWHGQGWRQKVLWPARCPPLR